VIVAGHSFLCRTWRWNLDSSTEGRFLLVAIVVHVDLLWVQGVRVQKLARPAARQHVAKTNGGPRLRYRKRPVSGGRMITRMLGIFLAGPSHGYEQNRSTAMVLGSRFQVP